MTEPTENHEFIAEPVLLVAEQEILQAVEMYGQIDWDRYEANNTDLRDPDGQPFTRNSLHVRIFFMGSILLSTKHGVEGSAELCQQYLDNAPGFEELIMALLTTYEAVKNGEQGG